MRKFTKMEVAAIKRTAANVNKFVAQKEKLAKKLEQINMEYQAIADSLEVWEAPIKKLTGGYTTEDLINKVVTTSTDKEGKQVTTVKYELKYPETVIPVTADNCDGCLMSSDDCNESCAPEVDGEVMNF